MNSFSSTGLTSFRSVFLFDGKSQHQKDELLFIKGLTSLRSVFLFDGKSQHQIKKLQRQFLELPLFFYALIAPYEFGANCYAILQSDSNPKIKRACFCLVDTLCSFHSLLYNTLVSGIKKPQLTLRLLFCLVA